MTKQVELSQDSIVSELIDDVILELCFDVHKATKIGSQSIEPERNFSESFVKYDQVHCYNCSTETAAASFAKHLTSCMGIESRKAKQKIKSFKESNSGEESDSDSDASSSKKKPKSKKGINNRNKQPKCQGTTLNYKDMTQEEMIAFFNKHCGVIAKRSKMPCKKTVNCTLHSKEEQESVRNSYLNNSFQELAGLYPSSELIDVDSIDEDAIAQPQQQQQQQQFFMPS